jgi:hypothetical protein
MLLSKMFNFGLSRGILREFTLPTRGEAAGDRQGKVWRLPLDWSSTAILNEALSMSWQAYRYKCVHHSSGKGCGLYRGGLSEDVLSRALLLRPL